MSWIRCSLVVRPADLHTPVFRPGSASILAGVHLRGGCAASNGAHGPSKTCPALQCQGLIQAARAYTWSPSDYGEPSVRNRVKSMIACCAHPGEPGPEAPIP